MTKAKRGPKVRKLWNLVQVAGFLDSKNPNHYSWVIEARDRDAQIRGAFTNEEWQSLNDYFDGLWSESERVDGLNAPPPSSVTGLSPKLIQVGLLSSASNASGDVNWEPVASYLRGLVFDHVWLELGKEYRLIGFGNLSGSALAKLLPFGPDDRQGMETALAEQGIRPNADGLYARSEIEDAAQWKSGRIGYKNGRSDPADGKRYDDDRVCLCTRYVQENTPTKFYEADRQRRGIVELADIGKQFRRKHPRLQGEYKAAAAALSVASASKHPHIAKLQYASDMAKQAVEANERSIRVASETLSAAVENLRFYRQSDADLNAFFEALYGPTDTSRVSDPRQSGNTGNVIREMFRRMIAQAEEAFETRMYWAENDARDDLPIDFIGPIDLRSVHAIEQRAFRTKLQHVKRWRDVFWRAHRPRLVDLK